MEKCSEEERGKARALRGTGDTSLREVRKGKVVERKREKQMSQEMGNSDGTTRELAIATPVQLSPSLVK